MRTDVQILFQLKVKMDNKLFKGLVAFAAIIFLLALLAASVNASGGTGCLGVDFRPLTCSCGNGQQEIYYNNEDYREAREDPKSCCNPNYKKKPAVTTVWRELLKVEYETGCWGVCPDARMNNAWQPLNQTGYFAVENGTWTEYRWICEDVARDMTLVSDCKYVSITTNNTLNRSWSKTPIKVYGTLGSNLGGYDLDWLLFIIDFMT